MYFLQTFSRVWEKNHSCSNPSPQAGHYNIWSEDQPYQYSLTSTVLPVQPYQYSLTSTALPVQPYQYSRNHHMVQQKENKCTATLATNIEL